MNDRMIPYTHWAYFESESAARSCVAELGDYVTRLRPSASDDGTWLLLAGRDVAVSRLPERHGEVEAIVERHGGDYDGGEATYLEGAPVADPLLLGHPDTD